jgi:hypothetical protein
MMERATRRISRILILGREGNFFLGSFRWGGVGWGTGVEGSVYVAERSCRRRSGLCSGNRVRLLIENATHCGCAKL